MNNTAVKQKQLDGPIDGITSSKVSHMFLSSFEWNTLRSTDVGAMGTGKVKQQRKFGSDLFLSCTLFPSIMQLIISLHFMVSKDKERPRYRDELCLNVRIITVVLRHYGKTESLSEPVQQIQLEEYIFRC